jgi:hypothetical protein
MAPPMGLETGWKYLERWLCSGLCSGSMVSKGPGWQNGVDVHLSRGAVVGIGSFRPGW